MPYRRKKLTFAISSPDEFLSYDAVLEPLIRDVQVLETDGIQVEINKTRYTLFDTVATISADSLSAHSLAGFRTCFSSGRICRFCMISYKEISQELIEDDVVLRKAASHEYHLKAVIENPTNVAIYGVRCVCFFARLKYVDTLLAFPPDVMHDFLEGIVPLVLQLLFCYSDSSGIVRVKQINEVISSFFMGRMTGHASQLK